MSWFPDENALRVSEKMLPLRGLSSYLLEPSPYVRDNTVETWVHDRRLAVRHKRRKAGKEPTRLVRIGIV